MKDLLTTATISRQDLESIFRRVDSKIALGAQRPAACSFQGAGTRTRTTFIQALEQLGLIYIDLPVFLDTNENPRDLAGYLDAYYGLYIIRYKDHRKLSEFARYSQRPVINAMSSVEHPCEAIADAYWFDRSQRRLDGAKIVLWGPTTNVLRSWHNVAAAAGATVHAAAEAGDLPDAADLVVTDGWPELHSDKSPHGLQIDHLQEMGDPVLLPTPPFTVGKEILFDPVTYPRFAGYSQKIYLLDVQKAIIRFLL